MDSAGGGKVEPYHARGGPTPARRAGGPDPRGPRRASTAGGILGNDGGASSGADRGARAGAAGPDARRTSVPMSCPNAPIPAGRAGARAPGRRSGSGRALVAVSVALAAGFAPVARAADGAGTKTVCTITINSPDERDAFRRYLPADRFSFVELVERGRPDWLESARRAGIRCDVLVVSGHYDGGKVFFSDQVDVREHLPVAEMERVSCSDPRTGLFSQLEEVYLFGCNTLNAEATKRPSCEVERSLVRAGHSPEEAARIARVLAVRHGESSRDRMRLVFAGVPVIYGFAATAPVGPVAASILEGYLKSGGAREVGSGRASDALLRRFRAHALVATRGVAPGDPEAPHRADVCRFADDRLSTAARLAFVHELLDREAAEARLFLDRIDDFVGSLDAAARGAPAVAAELDAIARDGAARDRFLAFARDADEPAIRARMVALAADLSWLTPADERDELARMIGERLSSRSLGEADVDLVCSLNRDRGLDPLLARFERESPADGVAQAAVLACLGSAAGRARALEALSSPRDEDVRIAQVYFFHRPLEPAHEVPAAVAGVAAMRESPSQVRALETIARRGVSDRASLDVLARLYAAARSADVQSAIAGILIRSDLDGIERAALIETVRVHRVKPSGGATLVDVLLRQLENHRAD